MMKLENQVCSLELAKRLKELGVKQESLFYWSIPVWKSDDLPEPHIGIVEPGCNYGDDEIYHHASAFTVAELGEMIPALSSLEKLHDGTFFLSNEFETPGMNWVADTEAGARCKMLIYL